MTPVPVPLALNLIDGIITGIREFFQSYLVQPIAEGVTAGLSGLVAFLVYSPAPRPPDALIFGRPTNAFWGSIYDGYWGTMVPLGYLLLVTSFFVVQLGQSWGISSPSRARGMKKNLLNGLFLIPAAWWLSVLLLRVSAELTAFLAPSPAAIQDSLGGLLQGGAFAGGIMLFVGASFNLLIVLLAVVLNLLRIVGILVIVYSLPVLIGFSYGGIPVLGTLGQKLYSKLPVLAFMALPTAIGLQITVFLMQDGSLNLGVGGLGDFIAPLFFIIPGVLGIAAPVLMYNIGLRQAGGRAASRMFGVSAGLTTGASTGEQATAAVDHVQQAGTTVRDRADQAVDIAGRSRTATGSAVTAAKRQLGRPTGSREDFANESMTAKNARSYRDTRYDGQLDISETDETMSDPADREAGQTRQTGGGDSASTRRTAQDTGSPSMPSQPSEFTGSSVTADETGSRDREEPTGSAAQSADPNSTPEDSRDRSTTDGDGALPTDSDGSPPTDGDGTPSTDTDGVPTTESPETNTKQVQARDIVDVPADHAASSSPDQQTQDNEAAREHDTSWTPSQESTDREKHHSDAPVESPDEFPADYQTSPDRRHRDTEDDDEKTGTE